MPKRQLKASALMSVVRYSLWLPLMLLPGLLSTSYASVSTQAVSEPPGYTDKQKIARLMQQRGLYLQAEAAFKKGHFNRFKQLTSKLSDYPLLPYLEYKSLLRKPSSLSRQQANDFLQANDDSVIGDSFRLKLIKHAAANKNWQNLIDVYRPGYSVKVECLYLSALIHTQQAQFAYPRIKDLWLSPHSQPNECDPAFKQWQAAGHRTPLIIWQRFKLAISKNNRQLAGFLIKSMPAKDASIARIWLKLHRNPQLVTSAEILNLDHSQQAEILLHGIKRLAYKDLDAAIDAYNLLAEYPFNAQQISQLNRHIGLRLARSHMPDANIWLSRIDEHEVDQQVKEWRIRTSIRQGDWSYVLQSIAQLTLEQQTNYRWQYWWAYANEQLGNINDAQGIYQYLSSKRSYYGFLAADQLNLQYSFEDKPVEPSVEVMTEVSHQPEALRARELYLLGKIIPARREWWRLINNIDTEQKLAASKLAQSWNWHDRAIVTMGKTRYRDDIELRFPLQHKNKVHAWSNKRNIEAAWTYAIIRRESAFMPDARSSVGAMGLMQLMPNTARMVARQLNIRYKGVRSLLTSNTNIRLGTGYLERMLAKLSSQQVLATAAYNAGPHRVEKWLPEHQKMDAIRWIETIPFTETREYVSNVLAYMVIYEHRMQTDITRLSHRMPPVPARNPQVAEQIQPDKTKKTALAAEKVVPGPS